MKFYNLEKVYIVDFLKVETTMMGDKCVCNEKGESIIIKTPMLVRESEWDKYKNLGEGYRSFEFVGYIEIDGN